MGIKIVSQLFGSWALLIVGLLILGSCSTSNTNLQNDEKLENRANNSKRTISSQRY